MPSWNDRRNPQPQPDPEPAAPLRISWNEVRNGKPQANPEPVANPGAGTGTTPYGHKALADECAKVASAAQGTRNDSLNRAAFRVGQLVPHQIDPGEAHNALSDAAQTCGLPPGEAAATIRSGLGTGQEQPRMPQAAGVEAWSAALDATEDDDDALHLFQVAERLRVLRVERDARAELARDGIPAAEPFDAGTLADILARPPEPAARVQSLIPWQASTLVVAQRKTGKTTLVLNLARCLTTGAPFLGSLPVRPIANNAQVAMLNYEVSGAQLARWADEAGVAHDRLVLVNLRGRRNPLTHPDDRAQLAELLITNRVETLIVDPFGRAYTGESQNDAGQVQSFLVGLDQFARADVGALDVILTAHAGWNGERTRGSSALEDWADSIITLTRDEDTGDRFLRATGRDVELDEDRLDFDQFTRTLSLSGGGSRKVSASQRRDEGTEALILASLKKHPQGLSGNALADLHKRKDSDFTRVRNELVDRGVIRQERRPGRGGGQVYVLTNPEGTEHTEKVPNAPLPNIPNLPSTSGGSIWAGLEPNIPRTSTGTCAECGGPNHPDRDAAGYPCLNCRGAA